MVIEEFDFGVGIKSRKLKLEGDWVSFMGIKTFHVTNTLVARDTGMMYPVVDSKDGVLISPGCIVLHTTDDKRIRFSIRVIPRWEE